MTKIEWAERTWNPIAGCSLVSPGCTNCYAMRQAGRLLDGNPATPHYAGTTQASKGGPVWTGRIGLAPERVLTEPLRRRKPTTYFVNSMGDLFHENVPDEWIDEIFAVMALSPQHTFQVLTKRAARMRAYIRLLHDECRWLRFVDPRNGRDAFAPEVPSWLNLSRHIWLGVSAEDQQRADERIPHLLATPAAVRFVSAEPLLSRINFRRISTNGGWYDSLAGWRNVKESPPPEGTLDWIIVGGESGRGARPMHPDWARSIRDQCAAAGTAFFFKQWGGWGEVYDRDRDDPDWRNCPTAQNNLERYVNLDGGHGFHGERVVFMRRVGKARAGRLLDGVLHDAMPEVRR